MAGKSCQDESSKNILIHNREKEIEHAAVVVDSLLRPDPASEKELKECLFADQPTDH